MTCSQAASVIRLEFEWVEDRFSVYAVEKRKKSA